MLSSEGQKDARVALKHVIRAILWDVGGTLAVLKSPSPVESISRTLARCSIDPQLVPADRIMSTHATFLSNERNWRTLYDEHCDRKTWATDLLQGLGLSKDARDALAVELRHYYDIYEPAPGIFDLLEELRDLGFRQAVVSNWPPSLPLFLKHHRLQHWFDAIIFSAEDGIHKPDPRIFHRALRRIHVRPFEAIMVGDDPTCDITGAAAIGMSAIHFDPCRQYENHDADNIARLRELLLARIA
jgi:HAD superfamily hydrolase (TIGR01549 family)